MDVQQIANCPWSSSKIRETSHAGGLYPPNPSKYSDISLAMPCPCGSMQWGPSICCSADRKQVTTTWQGALKPLRLQDISCPFMNILYAHYLTQVKRCQCRPDSCCQYPSKDVPQDSAICRLCNSYHSALQLLASVDIALQVIVCTQGICSKSANLSPILHNSRSVSLVSCHTD